MAMIALRYGQSQEVIVKEGRHSDIWIVLHRDHGKNSALHQATMEAGTHTAANQDVDAAQRFGKLVVAGVQALFDGKLDEPLPRQHSFFNIVDPELAALASVLGDGLAILAGDCDLHVVYFHVN